MPLEAIGQANPLEEMPLHPQAGGARRRGDPRPGPHLVHLCSAQQVPGLQEREDVLQFVRAKLLRHPARHAPAPPLLHAEIVPVTSAPALSSPGWSSQLLAFDLILLWPS